MSTVVRIYSDESAASGIAEQLKAAGHDHFAVSGRENDGSAREKETIVTDLMNQLLDRPVSEAYADQLAKGGTLIGVQPMFGAASKAARILDSVPSVETGIEREHATSTVDWSSNATPVSNALGWPVLLDHDASISETWRIGPLLTEGGPIFSWFGFRLLSDDGAPVSKMFGIPVLLDNPTPLSSKLGVPVLRDN
jgi:hypothetical protein